MSLVLIILKNKLLWKGAMKNIALSISLVIFFACTSTNSKQNIQSIQIGWSDDDTYTVQVSDTDEDNAVQRAKHKILKDIVDVRIRISSKFTDITKIREEFEFPLNSGVIINSKKINDGVRIYFQIREKGLRKKFQK